VRVGGAPRRWRQRHWGAQRRHGCARDPVAPNRLKRGPARVIFPVCWVKSDTPDRTGGEPMTGFDPFAKQGGPAAWDPQHRDNSPELADRLRGDVDEEKVRGDVSSAAATPEPAIDDDPHFAPEFTD